MTMFCLPVALEHVIDLELALIVTELITISYPCVILPILLAIVANVASAAVVTPLPVTAAAIRDLPSLTDVFSESNSSDVAIALPLTKALLDPTTNLLDFRKQEHPRYYPRVFICYCTRARNFAQCSLAYTNSLYGEAFRVVRNTEDRMA